MIKKATDFFGLTKPKSSTPEQVFIPAQQIPQAEKTIYMSWDANSRPPQDKLNPKLIKTLSVVGVVISLLLVLMGEFALIIVVASIIFMIHMLSQSQPETVHHEISNFGVINSDKFFAWGELKDFFFTNVSNTQMLAVDTVESLPGRLFFIFEPSRREEVKSYMEKYLPYLEEQPLTVFDKLYYQIISKFNFDK